MVGHVLELECPEGHRIGALTLLESGHPNERMKWTRFEPNHEAIPWTEQITDNFFVVECPSCQGNRQVYAYFMDLTDAMREVVNSNKRQLKQLRWYEEEPPPAASDPQQPHV